MEVREIYFGRSILPTSVSVLEAGLEVGLTNIVSSCAASRITEPETLPPPRGRGFATALKAGIGQVNAVPLSQLRGVLTTDNGERAASDSARDPPASESQLPL